MTHRTKTSFRKRRQPFSIRVEWEIHKIKVRYQGTKKMYFKIGDLLTAFIIGGLSGLCTFWIVGKGLNMFLAMFIGMCAGMALQVLVFLIFMPLFGAIEVMIPSMISGMLSGMSSGMIAASFILPSSVGLILGGGIGIMVCLWVHLQSQKLIGDT